ncbi:MAG: ATP-binding cassette domain-containing protein [Pseudoclavibacter sp.]
MTGAAAATRSEEWGAQDAVVRFGRRVALDGVSLTATPGRVVAVVGGDGAGKTTLLRLLAGRVRPESGTVRVPPRRELGYLPATAGVWGDLTVRQNIDFAAAAYRMPREEAAPRGAELLAAAGLAEAVDRLASRLSGGMRRKLGFVMAILPRPRLVVLDEPSTGVDPVSRVELWRLIARSAAEGAAVVFATTYPDEAERAEQVLALDAGRPQPWDEVRALARQAPPAPRSVRAAGGEPPAAPLVRGTGIVRAFGPHRAVDGVDIEVRAGEVVGLIGANGAGKTTLLRILLGLDRSDTGEISVLGSSPARFDRAALGYVPQGLGLWSTLTPAENAEFVGQEYGVPRECRGLPAGFEAAVRQRVEELDLGRQRRLAFDLAVQHRPRLLVLDEPTSGVSVRARAGLWQRIHAEAARGAGVIVTTHYLQEAAQCTRLVLLSRGRVAARGTVADVVAGLRAVRVSGARWAEAFTALDAAGIPVMLDGTAVRAAGADADAVSRLLDAAGVAAEVAPVPATLEEALVLVERGEH